MLSFKQFCEGWPKSDVLRRIKPALIANGKVFIGRRGDEHEDIEKRYGVKADPYKYGKDKDTHGFYDPRKKSFHSRSETDFSDLDTPELMTKAQRIRKYGDYFA